MKKLIAIITISIILASCSKKEEVTPDATIEFYSKNVPAKIVWFGIDGRHEETMTENRKTVTTKYDKDYANNQHRIERNPSVKGDSISITFSYEGKKATSFVVNKSGLSQMGTGVNYYALK